MRALIVILTSATTLLPGTAVAAFAQTVYPSWAEQPRTEQLLRNGLRVYYLSGVSTALRLSSNTQQCRLRSVTIGLNAARLNCL
jgi:hypothetical protein